MLFALKSPPRVAVQEVGAQGRKQDCEMWGAALELILSAMQLLGVADLKLLVRSLQLLLQLRRGGLERDGCVRQFNTARAGSTAQAVIPVRVNLT